MSEEPKREKVFDGRGDHLADARLTTFHADAADDLRLTFIQLRLLAHFGRQNGARGWLRVSQTELAERWGVSRQRINTGIRDLVEWGYLRKSGQEESGESFCHYKTLLGDVDGRLSPQEGGVSRPGDTPPSGGGGVSRMRDTGVILEGTPVSPTKDTIPDSPIGAEERPPIPRDRGDSGEQAGDEQGENPSTTGEQPFAPRQARLIAELRQEFPRDPAVERLLAPILAARRFSAADRPAALRELRQAAIGIATPALDKALEIVLAADVATIKRERISAAIDAVRKGGAMVPIRRGTPQWQRWLEFYDRTQPRTAELMRRYDSWQVRSEWPPAGASQGSAA